MIFGLRCIYFIFVICHLIPGNHFTDHAHVLALIYDSVYLIVDVIYLKDGNGNIDEYGTYILSSVSLVSPPSSHRHRCRNLTPETISMST